MKRRKTSFPANPKMELATTVSGNAHQLLILLEKDLLCYTIFKKKLLLKGEDLSKPGAQHSATFPPFCFISNRNSRKSNFTQYGPLRITYLQVHGSENNVQLLQESTHSAAYHHSGENHVLIVKKLFIIKHTSFSKKGLTQNTK